MLVSYSYFFQAGGWNQNSRLDLVRAIVEEQRLQIDSFHENTGDKSKVGEHYYSDKAPGQSLLAVPFIAASRVVLKFININPGSETGINIQAYIATFLTSVLPTVLSAFLLFWLGLKMGCSTNAAYFMMISFAFASPAWCYATLFFPHALAACLLLVSFCTVVALAEANSSKQGFVLSFIAGLAAEFMVLVE